MRETNQIDRKNFSSRIKEANEKKTASVDEFRKACLDWINYSVEDVTQELQVATLRLYNKLYDETPVDTAYAQSNWHISGRPSNKVIPYTLVDGKHEYASSDANRLNADSIRSLRTSRTGKFYITNNVPYMDELEAGYSAQNSGFIYRSYMEETAKIMKQLAKYLRV